MSLGSARSAVLGHLRIAATTTPLGAPPAAHPRKHHRMGHRHYGLCSLAHLATPSRLDSVAPGLTGVGGMVVPLPGRGPQLGAHGSFNQNSHARHREFLDLHRD